MMRENSEVIIIYPDICVWVKIRYPNNWMVNTKLDYHLWSPRSSILTHIHLEMFIDAARRCQTFWFLWLTDGSCYLTNHKSLILATSSHVAMENHGQICHVCG